MSLLFFTGSPQHYMAAPLLAAAQINCGPYFFTEEHQNVFRSLKTPFGEYDVANILRYLPLEQAPSAVVCLVDSSRCSVPRNLAFLPCPKVLLVADTHHLDRPLRGLIDYIAAERFDRVVMLYDRHHADILRRAGVKNLFWFPGLTFPHSDETVRLASQAERATRLAMVGQVGSFHPRRLRLAGALAKAGLPLEVRGVSQREALDFYGQSSAVFNASLNGDLNLRVFETLAAGAALLTDRLSPASGQEELWTEGREIVTYGSEAELVERARQLIANPAAARAIGAAGAQWFEQRFSAERRRSAFARLVYDGKAAPGFALPNPTTVSVSFSGEALAIYEDVQKVHAGQEQVRVVLDAAAPADFERLYRTLPRVVVEREGAGPIAAGADLAIAARGPISDAAASARRIWIWDAAAEQRAELGKIFAGAGFRPMFPNGSAYARPEEAPAALPPEVNRAKGLLAGGDVTGAFAAAREALARHPQLAAAYLIMAELATEAGQADLRAKMLDRARTLAPDDPGVWLLQLSSAAVPRLPERLVAAAWRAWDEREQPRTVVLCRQALEKAPQYADAYFLSGRADLYAVRTAKAWMAHGTAMQRLADAVRLAPDRLEYWRELAWERLRSGGLLPESIPAFRQALRLEPGNSGDWMGLGDALMALDRSGEAEAAYAEGLRHSPTDLILRRKLGHALKRQGKIEAAHARYRQSVGGSPAAPNRRRSRPRVVFVAQNGHSWPCMASVHAAFAADPKWETIVVALPWNHPSMMHSSRKDDANKIFSFLDEQGIAYVSWKDFPIGEPSADLLFLQNPYDSTRPEGWRVPELIRAGHRLCYVPYAIEFGGTHEDIGYQFNLPLQQFAWGVVARSEAHRRLFGLHCAAGNAHILVCGHPKFDPMAGGVEVEPDAELVRFAAGRPLVLWTPHFDVRFNGTRWGDGYSSFQRWRDFMIEEFARRPDLAFVIRPHPTFFPALEHRGIMTRAALDEWVARAEAAGNVRFNAGAEYYSVLAAADVLLSDASSLIIEFGISGKPIGYTHNPAGPMVHLDYELDFDFIRDHCTWTTTEEEVQAFLDAAAARRLPLSPERQAEIRRRMGVRPGGAGAEAKRAMEERFFALQAEPVRVAV